MENKYKLLSYFRSPPPSPNKTPFRERFGKLTLGTVPLPKTTKSPISEHDESLVTDDDSENEPEPIISDQDKAKIIRNILDSAGNDTEIDIESSVKKCVPYSDNAVSQKCEISQNLQLSETVETNCSVDMRKSLSVAVGDAENKKMSTPLFSTSSSGSEIMRKTSCRRKSTDETIVSRLSTQMDLLTFDDVNTNLPDDEKIRHSLLAKNQNIKNEDASRNNSILTISSTVLTGSENEESDGNNESYESAEDNGSYNNNKSVIMISDTDDGDDRTSTSTDKYEDHVSSLSQPASPMQISQDLMNKLNDFFTNIPSLPSLSERQPNLSMESLEQDDPVLSDVPEQIPETPEHSVVSNVGSDEEYIPETPEHSGELKLDEGDTRENTPDRTHSSHEQNKSVSSESPKLATPPNDDTNKSNESSYIRTETINISAKIHINIVISGFDSMSDSSSNAPDDHDDHHQNSNKNSNVENSHNTTESSHRSLQPNPESNMSSQKPESEKDADGNNSVIENRDCSRSPNRFDELNKSNFEIDEEMEDILNDMYGSEWKTPQLLKKCSSRKVKPAPTRLLTDPEIDDDVQNKVKLPPSRLSERVDFNDFSMFHKNIPAELESTRIDSMPKASKPQTKLKSKPTTETAKKHLNFDPSPPRRQRARRKAAEEVRSRIKSALDSSDDDEDFKRGKSKNSLGVNKDPENKSNSSQGRRRRVYSDDSDFDVDEASKSRGRVETKKRNESGKNLTNRSDPSHSRSVYGMATIETFTSDDDNSSDNASTSSEEDSEENFETGKIAKVLKKCEFKTKGKLRGNENMPPPVPPPISQPKAPVVNKRKLYNPNEIVAYDDTLMLEEEEAELQRRRELVKKRTEISPGPLLKLTNKKVEELKKSVFGNVFNFETPTKGKQPKSEKKGKIIRTPKTPVLTPLQGDPTKKYGFLESLDERLSVQFCHVDALTYRQNFPKTKVELAERLYTMFNENIFKFDKDIVVPITWNKKLLNTAGRCMTFKKKGVLSARIELSDKVITNADRLRCTLIHELCHAATWFYNQYNGHGIQWKSWVDRAMKIYPELPKISVCHAYEIEYKYTYRCKTCLAKSQAHSKSKKVENIRCRICHGAIEILINKRNNNGEIEYTPVREGKGFAKYVQQHYKTHKQLKLPHNQIMKVLGADFKNLSMTSKAKY